MGRRLLVDDKEIVRVPDDSRVVFRYNVSFGVDGFSFSPNNQFLHYNGCIFRLK